MKLNKILIAPDSFRGFLSNTEVTDSIEAGLRDSNTPFLFKRLPVADGGEGTTACIVEYCNGQYVLSTVKNLMMKDVTIRWGIIDNGKTAVFQICDLCGVELVEPSERDPMIATSYGIGEAIKIIMDYGCSKIVIGLGGSGTIDGGMGLLQALGVRFYDTNGHLIGFGGGKLREISKIDISEMEPRLKTTKIEVLCDTDLSLSEDFSIVKMFGPQKGATDITIPLLEAGLQNFITKTEVVCESSVGNNTFEGASGGIACALKHYAGATLISGIDGVLSRLGIGKNISDYSLVITGEGKMDKQTLTGKAPYGVAKLAKKYGVPVVSITAILDKELTLEDFCYFDSIIECHFSESNTPNSTDTQKQIRSKVSQFIQSNYY